VPSTYDKIQTTTLGSSQATVTFTSIASTYTDLVLVADFTMASPSGTVYIVGRVGNGSIDTGSNYCSTIMVGNGSAATSYQTGSVTYLQYDTYITGSNRAMTIANFQNYSNTTTFKTNITRTSSAATNTSAMVGLWRSTLAIDQVRLYDFSGNSFATGSTFTLYGIKAA
jgi:hypothetical protein